MTCAARIAAQLALLAAALAGPHARGAVAPDCAALRLPASIKGEIVQQEARAGGEFQPADAAALESLPAFCRVVAVLRPSPQSRIRIEVWLPRDWNGKFMGVGNGGFSGSVSYGALADGLRRGYATASTDTGHEGSSGRFALGQPQK